MAAKPAHESTAEVRRVLVEAKGLKAATLFSGIGAPEAAMPHWDWIWHAEIEKFPAAVMAHRHASSVNLGDVTAHDFCDRALAVGRPDVLVFGSPCQSFSVAGRRLGLDDPRGNLALVALGIVARLRPTWFVFENVPGLLSSADGRDFGLFLRTVDELGAALAWAVLDAQWFGVAQRRRRVFAVGHFGDWRGPAAILLESDRLCGDSPTRETSRKDVTDTLASRARSGGGYGPDTERPVIPPVSPAMKSRDGKGASSDGDGDGLPLICVGFESADSFCGSAAHDLMPTMKSGCGGVPPVAFNHQSGGDMRGIDLRDTAQLQQQQQTAVLTSGVRRLTPVECERLQGFPDNYTDVAYRGKPAADGPRYKAIGNSMAVPVVRWILSRLAECDRALAAPQEAE